MMTTMQAAVRTSVPLDTTIEIETPEHVRFRYQIAGPARRAAAYLIDLTIRGAFVIALAIVAMLVFAAGFGTLTGFETGALLVIYFAVEWGYYLLSELTMNGASPGKRALRLRVVQSDGLSITFTDSLLRNLVRAADLLPSFYVVGLLSMMLDAKFRRLGDLVAGTIVVHEPPTNFRPRQTLGRFTRQHGDQPDSLVLAELDALPPRLTLSRDEQNALALFSRRRAALSSERAQELADLIAPAFAKRWGVRYNNSAAFLAAVHQRASAQAQGLGR